LHFGGSKLPVVEVVDSESWPVVSAVPPPETAAVHVVENSFAGGGGAGGPGGPPETAQEILVTVARGARVAEVEPELGPFVESPP